VGSRCWYNHVVRIALPVLAATLVVTAGTGCSGDKQAQTATTASTAIAQATRPKPQTNQSRWAKQVDEICKPWQKRIDAVTPAPTNTASLQKWLEGALPLVRDQIAAVKAVKPPAKEDEARMVRLFLGSVQKTERALTRYLEAIGDKAPAKAQNALAEAGTSGAAARTYAVSLNITQCGGYSSG
jgi:hypothetical protein